MRLLRYLQSRPKKARAQYAALIAGVITGAVGVVWASTIPSRFAEVPSAGKERDELSGLIGEAKTQIGNVLTAEDALKANIGKNLDLLGSDTGDSIGELLAGPRGSSTAATATREKQILIETTNVTPKTILIGTTTGED